MGEMACYTKVCPECGRPPPVDMGSPSPTLKLPKCKFNQCVEGTSGDKNEKEAPYFQYPSNPNKENICATATPSDITTVSSK